METTKEFVAQQQFDMALDDLDALKKLWLGFVAQESEINGMIQEVRKMEQQFVKDAVA